MRLNVQTSLTEYALRMHFRDEPSGVSGTIEKIKSCINSEGDSAPGPDVKYSHMKGTSEKYTSDITDLLNQSLEKGHIQDDWLDSHLTLVPKPEKDPSKIASHCIITMQNTIGIF